MPFFCSATCALFPLLCSPLIGGAGSALSLPCSPYRLSSWPQKRMFRFYPPSTHWKALSANILIYSLPPASGSGRFTNSRQPSFPMPLCFLLLFISSTGCLFFKSPSARSPALWPVPPPSLSYSAHARPISPGRRFPCFAPSPAALS